MKTEIKPTKDLNYEEINTLWKIYQQHYVGKNIGHKREVWEKNLSKSYHQGPEKTAQFYNQTEGYTLSTVPIEIEGKLWSKILEGGIDTSKGNATSISFISMIKQLVEYNNNINYIIEVDHNEEIVKNLLHKAGFNNLGNKELGETLMKKFLQPDNIDFKLNLEEKLLKIIRTTTIKPKKEDPFIGYLVVKT